MQTTFYCFIGISAVKGRASGRNPRRTGSILKRFEYLLLLYRQPSSKRHASHRSGSESAAPAGPSAVNDTLGLEDLIKLLIL